MIEAVTVERFRGLRRLEVENLGRVNLIIGKNDCGKTALMEALGLAEHPEAAGLTAATLQQSRLPDVDFADFTRCWLPLFWNQDAESGFSVSLRLQHGRRVKVSLGRAKPSSTILVKGPRSPSRHASWTLNVQISRDGETSEQKIESTDAGLAFPSAGGPENRSGWIKPSKTVGPVELQLFSRLKQSGREAQLFEILSKIDERVHGIELLALTGGDAELFVRTDPGSPLLPIAMMGDGFQRCFEIGVAVIADDSPLLFIDEFDNGLHHSVLEPVWRWIAMMSAERDVQVFATTHSEECIQAACSAFAEAKEDDLRVIRLSRQEDRTTATVYDRTLVEAATRMDVEIRG